MILVSLSHNAIGWFLNFDLGIFLIILTRLLRIWKYAMLAAISIDGPELKNDQRNWIM